MDLEGENSKGEESVEDNQVTGSPSGKLTNAVETKIESNGTCAVDETKAKEIPILEVVSSADLVTVKSSSSSPTPRTTKGKGLRKWRRIKREVCSEGGSNLDTNKLLLKRGLSNPGANSNRSVQFSADMKQNSEGSVSSTNATLRNLGTGVDHFVAISDLGFGMSPVLAVGLESENSEDRSSKSSTAASAPKMRYEMPVAAGFPRDKNGIRSLSGKSSGNPVHRGNHGKARTDTSKKLRGETVKIEKENSHSSMESDSRSSNFVFMQGKNSATSNGRRSGKSINYNGENSDEAQGSERQFSEEPQAGSNRKYGGDFEVTSKGKLVAESTWGFKEENNGNNGPSREVDPMVESIVTLQSVQEELEKEVQKFREIGKENLTDDSSLDGLNEQLQSDNLFQELSDTLEPQIASLKQAVNLLESKLDDAAAQVKVKESRIVELEGILNGRSLHIETGHSMELHQNYRDIEIELEGLFKQKIEAEVEYLAISRTIQKLRVAVVDQISILEEQKTEQVRMMRILEDTETKAAMLNELSKKLENYGEDIASADEIKKLKSRVCKYTSCFFLQLILLVIILTFFLWRIYSQDTEQFYPQETEVVPT